jgi:dihydropteroate synthase
MGILNLTPDSFSDGGAYPDAEAAIAAGLAMRDAGADIVDAGGESTRPGAAPVAPEQEQARVLPVIRALARAGVLVSVDTRNAATMAAALDCGAGIVNDISALAHDPAAAPLLARRDCAVVLMHTRGDPATMSSLANYADVTAEVTGELAARIAAAERAGIARARLAIDPGFGFAKHPEHSTALLRGLPALRSLGLPILVGVSRKGFIGRLANVAEPRRRDAASLAAGLFALLRGAAILRVHNVSETCQALKVWRALTRT